MEIKNLYRIDKPGKLKAIFTVETDKLELRGFRLMENDKGELWATPPSESYEDKKTKEKKWSYHYRIKDRVLMDKITDLAKQKYGNNSSDIDDVPF